MAHTEKRFEPDIWKAPDSRNWPVTDQVAMTEVAAVIVAGNADRGSVDIQNLDSANDLFVGNEDVSASTGFRLKAGEGKQFKTRGAIYGICSAGLTATAAYCEEDR